MKNPPTLSLTSTPTHLSTHPQGTLEPRGASSASAHGLENTLDAQWIIPAADMHWQADAFVGDGMCLIVCVVCVEGILFIVCVERVLCTTTPLAFHVTIIHYLHFTSLSLSLSFNPQL